jgi:hypothetical protein
LSDAGIEKLLLFLASFADFDVGGFALLVGYNTFFRSSTADWPEFADGGGTMMSARLQKQTGTCDLNIVLN